MRKFGWMCLVVVAFLVGCSRDTGDTDETSSTASIDTDLSETATPPVALLNFADTAAAFHDAAETQMQAMLSACLALQQDVQGFLSSPSDESQSKAQTSFVPCYQQWIQARVFHQQPFGLSEEKSFSKLMDLIDTRPFLPGYIDGLPEYPFSGLVHELDIPINANTLRGQHRLMDEDSASVGFPVIEFFLWKVPADEHWVMEGVGDKQTVIQRRRDYLNVAMTLLTEQLTEAVIRWQEDNEFVQLPERAQLSFVLKSVQRLTMVELLAGQFEETAINDPEWHHAAFISGNGRSYPIAKLKGLLSVFGETGDNAASQWLTTTVDVPVSVEELRVSISDALSAIEALPENYPADSQNNEAWQSARQKLAQLTLHFSRLSEHFQVAIVTE